MTKRLQMILQDTGLFNMCMPHFSAVSISCLIALCHTVKRWAVESNRAQWDIRDTRTFPASKHLKQIIACGFLVRGELLAELKGNNSKQVKSWNTDILDLFLKKKNNQRTGTQITGQISGKRENHYCIRLARKKKNLQIHWLTLPERSF